MPRSALVVDDDPRVRMNFARELEQLEFRVAMSCASAEEALVWVEGGGHASVALIDIGLPGIDGIGLIRRLRRRRPAMRLLVITVFDDTPTIVRALRAGARGYLLKDSAGAQFEAALSTVWQGGTAVDGAAAAHLVEHFNAEGLDEWSSSGVDELLTPREQEVLNLLCRGLTYADVARVLEIGVGTVQTYVKAIYAKLEVTSKAEATAVALARKLVKPWAQ